MGRRDFWRVQRQDDSYLFEWITGHPSSQRCWNPSKDVDRTNMRGKLAGTMICLALLWAGGGAAVDGVQQGEDIGRVMGSLLKAENDLVGYIITARDSNVTFSQYGTLQAALSSKTNLSPEVAAEMEALVRHLPAVATNTCVYTYRFGSEAVLTRALEADDRGQPKTDKRILATSQYVLESRISLQVRDDGKPNIPDGRIWLRKSGVTGGWPMYLSRATLGELIKASPGASSSSGTLPNGEKCYTVDILATSNTPIANRKLVLTADDLRPVELCSYLPDGTLYSRTTLDFSGDAKPPELCRTASYEQFRDGHVYQRSVWRLESVARLESPPTETVNGFFAPLTAVMDERFSRPLTYMVGSRLPNNLEVEQMLTNRHGVARFEAATLSRGAGPLATAHPRLQAAKRVVVALVLVLTTLMFLIGYRYLAKPKRV